MFNNSDSENNIVGFLESKSLLVKVSDLKETDEVKTRIKNSKKYAIALSATDSIKLFEPHVTKPHESKKLKISLINYYNTDLKQKALF